MKNIIIIGVMIMSYYATNAQHTIKGRITDQNNVPLPGATVFITDLNKGAVADKDGNYELLNLPTGKIRIQFSFVGFCFKGSVNCNRVR